MSKLLSIIIPVYGVEHTLNRCVESVLRQNVDMEIILVDDGSPDNCPIICDKWAEKDERVIVIHKENGGLSDARNAGLKVAKGCFVTFVDSDDEVQDGTFDAVCQDITDECDIVEYPIFIDYGSNAQHILAFDDRQSDITTKESLHEYWLGNKIYEHCYACNKIFRRSLFDDLCFPVGRTYEDLWLLPSILCKVRKAASSSKGMYLYYYNKEGLCRSERYEAMRLEALLHAVDVLGIECNADKAQNMLLDILNAQITAFKANHETNHKAEILIRNIRFSSCRSWKEWMKLLLLKIIGLHFLCLFLAFMNVLNLRTFHVKNAL